MNPEKISATLFEHTKEIAALWESAKSSHKRQDGFEKMAESINKLAENVAANTAEVKLLAKSTSESIARIEKGMQRQGERIGELEKEIRQIQRNEEEIKGLASKLDELRMEPGKNWKNITFEVVRWAVMGLLALAAASNFFYIGMYY